MMQTPKQDRSGGMFIKGSAAPLSRGMISSVILYKPPGNMIAGVGVRLTESRQPELANVHHKYLSANLLEAPRASTGGMETSPPVLLSHFKPWSVHSIYRSVSLALVWRHTLFWLAVI